MDPSCLGRWGLQVRMAFAVRGKNEKVSQTLSVPQPSQIPCHPLLLTDCLGRKHTSVCMWWPKVPLRQHPPGECLASDGLEQVYTSSYFL